MRLALTMSTVLCSTILARYSTTFYISVLLHYNRTVRSLSLLSFKAVRPARLRTNVASGAGKSTNVVTHSSLNPTLEWKNASCSTSEFVTHVMIEEPCSVKESVDRVINQRSDEKTPTRDETHQKMKDNSNTDSVIQYTSSELLRLGAVWFLPATAPRDPSLGVRPKRLLLQNASTLLQTGDYMRIHFNPRRFPTVHDYDWGKRKDSSTDRLDGETVDNKTVHKPGVIVAQNERKGWMVIDKPAHVPVHMTVDNCMENAATCLEEVLARQSKGNDSSSVSYDSFVPYVSAPQRLDQNTSGLIVFATTKTFANYFAGLLRNKTAHQLEGRIFGTAEGVHKLYRCLVCVLQESDSIGASWSLDKAVAVLKAHEKSDSVMRHYLAPSVRAPKHFASEPASSDWAECLLKIRNISKVYGLAGTAQGDELARALWDSSTSIPRNCRAVVELDIELLTGRTHQIRGQLSAAGFPLVGDAQYGGAVPTQKDYYNSNRLALQCCKLEFLDPIAVSKKDGSFSLVPSQHWNSFELADAWWSPILQNFIDRSKPEAAGVDATLASDIGLVEKKAFRLPNKPARPDLLPARVSLSPGKNKYVLIRATHPNAEKVEWFVKSAAPHECGGPYHGNVAQDLREWIQAAGYDVKVTGGGRIDYRPDDKIAVLFGFSYGFGKADHACAAALIQEWSHGSIATSVDNSDDLY